MAITVQILISAQVADPGAPRQVAHPDTPWFPDPALLTAFVALQPIDLAMGPTLFFPRTNTQDAHAQFFHHDPDVKDALLTDSPTVVSTLGQGDVSIFDSRTIHCGTANVDSTRSRCLFYFSFLHPDIDDPQNPGSIRPAYDSRLTLTDLRSALPSSSSRRGGIPSLFADLSRDDYRSSRRDDISTSTTTRKQKKSSTANPKKKNTSSGHGFGSSTTTSSSRRR